MHKIRVMDIFLFYFWFFFSFSVWADGYLLFPDSLSSAQPLQQSFDYELVSKTEFLLGDLLIDSDEISLQFNSVTKYSFKINFQWTGDLFKKGNLILLDNSGKAIWQNQFNFNNLVINKAQSISLGTDGKWRKSVFSYKTNAIDISYYETMKRLPFFRFCIHQKEERTQIYLCSQEFFFKRTNEDFSISTRHSLRSNPYVEINGHLVNKKGRIFLQSTNETISLKTRLGSGVTLTFDTRPNPVYFMDISRTKSDKLSLTAKGAEPIKSEDIITRKGPTWTAEVPMSDPVLFLAGEGGIPLRQDFALSEKIRPESLQIPYFTRDSRGTYETSNTLILKPDPNVSLASVSQTTHIVKNDDGSWKWTVYKLKPGRINRRFLRVSSSEGSFLSSMDFYRTYRYEISSDLAVPTTALSLRLQQLLTLNWAWNLSYLSNSRLSPSETGFSLLSMEGIYFLSPNITLPRPGSFLGFSIDNYDLVRFNSLYLSLIGALALYPNSSNEFFDSFLVKLKIPSFPLDSSSTLDTSAFVDFSFQKIFRSWKFEVGPRYELLRVASSNFHSEINQVSFIFGLASFF